MKKNETKPTSRREPTGRRRITELLRKFAFWKALPPWHGQSWEMKSLLELCERDYCSYVAALPRERLSATFDALAFWHVERMGWPPFLPEPFERAGDYCPHGILWDFCPAGCGTL